jgi:hypothetical protein
MLVLWFWLQNKVSFTELYVFFCNLLRDLALCTSYTFVVIYRAKGALYSLSGDVKIKLLGELIPGQNTCLLARLLQKSVRPLYLFWWEEGLSAAVLGDAGVVVMPSIKAYIRISLAGLLLKALFKYSPALLFRDSIELEQVSMKVWNAVRVVEVSSATYASLLWGGEIGNTTVWHSEKDGRKKTGGW